METIVKLQTLAAHVDRLVHRLERTSFRDAHERTLLVTQLTGVVGGGAKLRHRGSIDAALDAQLALDARDATDSLSASITRLRAIDPGADDWRHAVAELSERFTHWLAVEEDRLAARRSRPTESAA